MGYGWDRDRIGVGGVFFANINLGCNRVELNRIESDSLPNSSEMQCDDGKRQG